MTGQTGVSLFRFHGLVACLTLRWRISTSPQSDGDNQKLSHVCVSTFFSCSTSPPSSCSSSSSSSCSFCSFCSFSSSCSSSAYKLRSCLGSSFTKVPLEASVRLLKVLRSHPEYHHGELFLFSVLSVCSLTRVPSCCPSFSPSLSLSIHCSVVLCGSLWFSVVSPLLCWKTKLRSGILTFELLDWPDQPSSLAALFFMGCCDGSSDSDV